SPNRDQRANRKNNKATVCIRISIWDFSLYSWATFRFLKTKIAVPSPASCNNRLTPFSGPIGALTYWRLEFNKEIAPRDSPTIPKRKDLWRRTGSGSSDHFTF